MLNKPRLLTPGPTPLPEEVRLALSRDMCHHRKTDFQKIMRRVQEKCQRLFGTSQPVLPLACSGTGAMTAAVFSLLDPGDHALVINAGKFGERWQEIANNRGVKIITLDVEWGYAVNPEDVKDILGKHPEIKAILMQLCETSTGVLQPVREIGAIKGEKLLIVDGISAVGISPCPMDEWRIDCLLTGSQKGLMLPPGLALLALSENAWQTARQIQPGCYYFNLPKERSMLEKGQTAFTTPINLIIGLDAALDMLFTYGLPALYKKQFALSMLVRQATLAMGLSLLAQNNWAWGVTAIVLPDGIDGGEILKRLEKDYGIIMAGGQDRLKGRIVRFGHMGWIDWGDCVAGLSALAETLSAVGYAIQDGFLVKGLEAYHIALNIDRHPVFKNCFEGWEGK